MYKIALIDDKSYWIDQIKWSIPENINYEFIYFDSYKKALNTEFDIILLDYFLDLDHITWDKIISKLKYKKLIGFSSSLNWSKKIFDAGWDYFCQKTRYWRNHDLENIFWMIFYSDFTF